MQNDQFFYDATGFNTLENLADIILRAAEGDWSAGSDEWENQLRALPIDSMSQFNSPDVVKLKLEEVLRSKIKNAGQIERLRGLADQAVDDLSRLHQFDFEKPKK
jgi:hypothetical protein